MQKDGGFSLFSSKTCAVFVLLAKFAVVADSQRFQ